MRAIRRPRPTQALCQTDAMITRTPRILLASALAAALFFTGCSDDGGDDAADTGNGGTVSAEYAELCDAARSGQNASGSEQLAETPRDRELARGLVHLAAAGFRGLTGDAAGRERQLVHARRRLAPFLPLARRVDLEALLREVERAG